MQPSEARDLQQCPGAASLDKAYGGKDTASLWPQIQDGVADSWAVFYANSSQTCAVAAGGANSSDAASEASAVLSMVIVFKNDVQAQDMLQTGKLVDDTTPTNARSRNVGAQVGNATGLGESSLVTSQNDDHVALASWAKGRTYAALVAAMPEGKPSLLTLRQWAESINSRM